MKYGSLVWISMLVQGLSCGGQVGTQGPTGPMGAEGKPGVPGPTITDCPEDYQRDMSAPGIILCRNGTDEIVKVGKGRSAFWIDRYEASVWLNSDGTGAQYGVSKDDYPDTFPKNGQVQVSLYAASKSGVTPSRFITWFQAIEACAANGKRLPTNQEWQRAARGTHDPEMESPGDGGTCVTKADVPRSTGGGTNCVSNWGAQDMAGNLWEWAAEWHVGVGQVGMSYRPWPDSSYGNDGTWNITSKAVAGGSFGVSLGLPSASSRGGAINDGIGAGIFAIWLDPGPSDFANNRGFRCVTPR